MKNQPFAVLGVTVCALLVGIGCQPQITGTPPDQQEAPSAQESGVPASAEASSAASTQEVTDAPTPTTAPSETATPTPAPVADGSAFDPVALDMLVRLNDWRASVGAGPLAVNPMLQSLAQAQFDYLLSLPVLPDGLELHVDAEGQYARERAIAAGWPHYSTDVQTALSEIICANAGPAECIAWWQGSESHRIAASNPGFREVGVAGGPWAFGYVYVATLGSQPNVLPALVDPVSQQLYPGTEQYRFSGGGDWIGKVTEYQILPSVDSQPAADAWQPWALTVPLPDTSGEPFAVAYTDGTSQVIAPVDPRKDTAWLPDVLAAIATPEPTSVPATAAPAKTSTQAATATTAATPTPRRTPTPEGPAGIVFVYDANSMTVINTTDNPVDLTKMVLTNGTDEFPLSQFQAFSLSLPLNAFPADGCIQAWNSNGAAPAKPTECKVLYSSMNITADKAFWGTSDFDVQNDGKTVAECTAAAGRCVAVLP